MTGIRLAPHLAPASDGAEAHRTTAMVAFWRDRSLGRP